MNGKGDKPRNCFSEDFRQNHNEIDWRKTPFKKGTKLIWMPPRGDPIEVVYYGYHHKESNWHRFQHANDELTSVLLDDQMIKEEITCIRQKN